MQQTFRFEVAQNVQIDAAIDLHALDVCQPGLVPRASGEPISDRTERAFV